MRPIRAFATSSYAEKCSPELLSDFGIAVVNCSGLGACSPQSGFGSFGPVSDNIPEPHKSILVAAAGAYAVSPNLLAALYLTKQGNNWRPIDGSYRYENSPVGEAGPFQFMPGTWRSHQQDGDGDGVKDIQNFTDAAYAAGDMASSQGMTIDTPLGSVSSPLVNGTVLRFAINYNWGAGNADRVGERGSLSALREETQNYVLNMYELFSSDFTRSGHPEYGNPNPEGGESSGVTGNTTNTLASCGPGGPQIQLPTTDRQEAIDIIKNSSQVVWANASGTIEAKQKNDLDTCMETTTLLSIAAIVKSSPVPIPVNSLARDNCSGVGSFHNRGRAIDIGYFGAGARGDPYHTDEGDTLYKLLFDNREVLRINELIWQYPPVGYECINAGNVGPCDQIYSAEVMNIHYHHIHIAFGI